MKFRIVPFLLLCFFAGGCARPVQAQASGCKPIAFALSRAGAEADIYSICPDGSRLTQLTDDQAADSAPAWSPDGTSLAFASARSGKSQVYVMDGDGGNLTQLTFDEQNDLPVWLPDGKQIAFRTTDGVGLWWWRILNLESQEVTTYTAPSYDFFFQTPAWSPDGEWIAYMSLEEQKLRNDGSSQIHIKKVDGSDDVALTHDIWANIRPVWSADSQRIAFLSERDGTYNVFALYVMDRDGKNVSKLSDSIFYSETNQYSWSSDGRQVVIDGGLPQQIYLVDVETGHTQELLPLQEGESAASPTWQP